MTSEQLKEIVDQRLRDPHVLGRIACNLREEAPVEQKHHDQHLFKVSWEDCGDFWRATVLEDGGAKLAQVDVHENGTTRVDAFAPARVTVSPDEELLCITRYRS
jgi:hypothetical protein